MSINVLKDLKYINEKCSTLVFLCEELKELVTSFSPQDIVFWCDRLTLVVR